MMQTYTAEGQTLNGNHLAFFNPNNFLDANGFNSAGTTYYGTQILRER